MNKPYCVGSVAVLIGDRWNESRVVDALQAAGLQVETPPDHVGLLSLAGRQPVDVVLMEDRRSDLVECLASLRFHGLAGIPVVAFGPGTTQHIIDAMGQGAADYICTAEAPELLANRVQARIVLSRRPLERTVFQLGDLELDADSRALRGPDFEFNLTSREFELAWMLFEHAGGVVNLQALSCRVWGREASLAKRTIEQHISRVRQKLARAGAAVGAMVQLQAIHNIGYRLTYTQMLMKRATGDELPAAA